MLKEKLTRKWIRDNTGNDIEINIIGKGKKGNQEIIIICESKSQLSKEYVDEFIRKKLNRLNSVYPNIKPVLVTHMISTPDVEQYAKEKNIQIFYSYQLN